MAPAASAGLTVTVLPGEHCDADVESVTLTEYVEVAVGEALYADEAADGMAVVHVPSEYHW
jgi:hypothetical protein